MYYAHKLVFKALNSSAAGQTTVTDTATDSLPSAEYARSLRKENIRLKRELRDAAVKLAKAEKNTDQLESERERLIGRVADLETRPSREGQLLRENRKLRYRLEALEKPDTGESDVLPFACDRFIKDLQEIPTETVDALTPCEKYGTCPLNELRIAVVGGLDRLETRYRTIVEGLGGTFMFHSGSCNNGAHMLRNMVCGSDIVVFITSVNSHNAMWIVKAECKKTGKKFTVLKQTSPEALEKKLLAEVAG